MMVHNRKLLQQLILLVDHHDQEPGISQSLRTTLSTTIHYTTPEPELLPPNNSSSTLVTGSPGFNRPLNTPFDSSMALTILVLLTALFFMAFFSVYIRRFSNDNTAGIRSSSNNNHNHNTTLPSSSSSSSSYNNTKRRGLDPAAVRALPIVAYGSHASHGLIDCAICLAEFEEGEMVKMIPCCRQVFHSACIDTWLASHMSCPLCRSTTLCGAQEISLSSVNVIMQVENDEDLRGRSTVEESNTGTCELLLPVGLRRTCSCSSLEQRLVLQRSRSF